MHGAGQSQTVDLVCKFHGILFYCRDHEIQFYEMMNFEPYCQLRKLESVPLRVNFWQVLVIWVGEGVGVPGSAVGGGGGWGIESGVGSSAVGR